MFFFSETVRLHWCESRSIIFMQKVAKRKGVMQEENVFTSEVTTLKCIRGFKKATRTVYEVNDSKKKG